MRPSPCQVSACRRARPTASDRSAATNQITHGKPPRWTPCSSRYPRPAPKLVLGDTDGPPRKASRPSGSMMQVAAMTLPSARTSTTTSRSANISKNSRGAHGISIPLDEKFTPLRAPHARWWRRQLGEAVTHLYLLRRFGYRQHTPTSSPNSRGNRPDLAGTLPDGADRTSTRTHPRFTAPAAMSSRAPSPARSRRRNLVPLRHMDVPFSAGEPLTAQQASRTVRQALRRVRGRRLRPLPGP